MEPAAAQYGHSDAYKYDASIPNRAVINVYAALFDFKVHYTIDFSRVPYIPPQSFGTVIPFSFSDRSAKLRAGIRKIAALRPQ
jgi:hypothetical protein